MKIDTSKIEGYAGMTPEEKIAALEGFDHPDPDYTGYVTKETFDRTASDLAAWKKKYTETLSAEERKKQEQDENLAQMKRELDALRAEKTLTENKAQFLKLGYSEDLATATAKALSEGDTTTVFANQQKFLEEYAKQIKANGLKGTPRPPAGAGSTGVDYAAKIQEAQTNGDFSAVAYYTRLAAMQEAQNQ